MIIGVGTDICENYRIQKIVNKYQHRLLTHIFTDEELAYCLKKKDPIPHLSARFALKEAFIKALSLKKRVYLSFNQVGLKGNEGKKDLIIKGKLFQLYQQTGAKKTFFSISHSKNNSIAYVILEK
ncbi:MAG: holo-ACP synthase [Spirochaetia bacterium]|nr:holo-ACP synthase [Spirochaetia bacterium]